MDLVIPETLIYSMAFQLYEPTFPSHYFVSQVKFLFLKNAQGLD